MSNKKPFPYVPVGPRVIVLRDKAPDKSEGGILFSPGAKELPLEGEVVAVGSGDVVRAGDRVLFSEHSGITLPVGLDGDYLVLLEEEVLCFAFRVASSAVARSA